MAFLWQLIYIKRSYDINKHYFLSKEIEISSLYNFEALDLGQLGGQLEQEISLPSGHGGQVRNRIAEHTNLSSQEYTLY